MQVPDLSTFEAAAEATGLDELLSAASAEGLTVFAPSDDAWAEMMEVKGFNSTGDLLDWPRLAAVLLLHAGEGFYSKEQLASADGPVGVPTLSPGAFSVVPASLDSRLLIQGGGEGGAGDEEAAATEVPVLYLDHPTYDPTSDTGVGSGAVGYRSFSTSNGVLYVVNAVMAPPPELVSAVAAEPALSNFSAALNVTGVGVCVPPLLAGRGPRAIPWSRAVPCIRALVSWRETHSLPGDSHPPPACPALP